ncbi:MAG: hypothetical protein IAF08_09155 [Rhizobacter sp.]|nr:hypothetical protein [Chlorobiales bacterium]
MNEETNKLLEAILLVLQENGKDIRGMKNDICEMKDDARGMQNDIREMKGDIREMKGDIRTLNGRMSSVENAVKENTREITLLREAVERHEIEIGKVVEIYG